MSSQSLSVPLNDHGPSFEVLSHELTRRMQGPQRHRLLHGYPLSGALPRVAPRKWVQLPTIVSTRPRPLLVGVLPHAFCNPRVPACGFCTFPHEAFRADRVARMVRGVCSEIEWQVRTSPELQQRTVTGLYFGGGTANLTPPEDFQRLCQALAKTFDLGEAEITLEGIPSMFLSRKRSLLTILGEDLPSPRIRLSMGIQTFDTERLAAMGRLSFGSAKTFAGVVLAAHGRQWTVSADLLINLPNQTLSEMESDVAQAIDLGLDQICLYHLVLFRGLGTPWSRDHLLMSGLSSNEVASENWLVLRQRLLDAGYVQTTLTNFEREQVHHQGAPFLYENCSFQPQRFDMLGFGPGSISFRADDGFTCGVKTVNPESSADYLSAIEEPFRIWDRYFPYKTDDLRVFYLTRRLAALDIVLSDYLQTFGIDCRRDFADELQLLEQQGLISIDRDRIRPTLRGMFYADSVAGLLAYRRLRDLRAEGTDQQRQGMPGQQPQVRKGRHRGFMG